MGKTNSDQDQIKIGTDINIEPLPKQYHPSFLSPLKMIDPVTAGAVSFQVLGNTIWRQFFANARLGVNTGETVLGVMKRLIVDKPLTSFSGTQSRFILQMVPQGLPAIVDRSASRPDVENPTQVSVPFTALVMTLFGMVMEPINLTKPIQDKSDALDGKKINFKSRLPSMIPVVTPFIFARSACYAQAVLGNHDKPLPERAMVAGLVGAISNPIDNAVNVAAYEAAIAKDGTPLKEIFYNVLKSFVGTSQELPYERLVKCIGKSLSGVVMRTTSLAGACIMLSPEITHKLEKNFDEYSESIKMVWDKFQNQVADKGGVDPDSVQEQKAPSSTVGKPSIEVKTQEIIK